MARDLAENDSPSEMERAQRAIAARGACCRAVVSTRNAESLLADICRGLVDAGYAAAAAHLVSATTEESKLVACAGIKTAKGGGHLEVPADATSSEDSADNVLTVYGALEQLPADDPLLRAARDSGGRSLARIRIRMAEGEIVHLSVFAPETEAFRGEETNQLGELGHDLKAGLRFCASPEAKVHTLSSGRPGTIGGGRAPSARTRRRADQALREQLELIRSITDSAQDAIILADDEGSISYWNRAAQNIFGWTAEEVLGQPVHRQLLPEGSRETARRWFGSDNQSDDGNAVGQTLELSAVRKDGSEFPVEASIASVRLRGRWQAIGIIRDITVRKRFQLDLEKAKKDAEAAAEAKSMFLANVSHELRTPLNAIIGMTDLLLDTPLDRQQYDFARTVRRSGEILLAVINDILDFSKIGSGVLEFESIPFSVRASVEEIGDLLAQKAAVKGIELVILIDHLVPSRVEGDPGRLRQVLTNLVNNAIKFTEKGEVVVSAKPIEGPAEKVGLEFAVEDTGVGIPAERLGDLFQPFMQADASTTRRFGGTGLGLSIAKNLVERMGGTLIVDSREGVGSTFRFTAFFTPAGALDEDMTTQRNSLDGLKILIVDDNRTNRNLLEEILGRWGCTTESAASGGDALDLLFGDDEPFYVDLAILDFSMPGMDGASLATAIKANPAFLELPLILLTSMPEHGDGERMRKAGFSAYLTKPIKQEYLYDAILSVMSESARDPVEQAPLLVTRHTLREAQQSCLRILVVEDNPINQKVAARMLDRLGYRCDLASNGCEAIEACVERPYDVILMDCKMPVMDGFEATRRIRENERDGEVHIPIVATTADALEGDRDRCLEAGMDGYISKPIDIHELAETLERLDLATDRTKSTLLDGSSPLTLDPSRIRNVSRGNVGFQRRLLELFLRESGNRRGQISSALKDEDSGALREHAHSLKGSTSTIGADATAELAGRLQGAAEEGDLEYCATLSERLFRELNKAQTGIRNMLDELTNDETT
jgi:two-component system sensor histidine kinase/response regulator